MTKQPKPKPKRPRPGRPPRGRLKVTIRLAPDVVRALDAARDRLGQDKSSIVNQALRIFLKLKPSDDPPAPMPDPPPNQALQESEPEIDLLITD